jgi:myo-inositol 2-dehydrogenase/D-chiro-inositol 1-dehydrogenase
MSPLGVGLIGAGPVTQAIHLPTLATLADRLQVRHVMDVDREVATAVAARVGARATTDVDQLLADDDVDVVAVCSPHQFHADQVAAAARAGKRGVLCEKPLGTTVDEARRIAAVSAETGIPVVVGAMHAYDPAVVASFQALNVQAADTQLVHVRTYLPANGAMVDLATDPLPSPSPTRAAEPDALEAEVAMLRGGILGLATHDLPLVRSILPEITEVTSATTVRPFGYELAFRCGAGVARLVALMPGQWQPDWTLDAWGPNHHLHLAFPPSYVLAGSTVAELRTAAGSRSWRYAVNGYQGEWLHLADVVTGRAELAISVQEAVADLLYALQLADGAEKLIRSAA